MGKGNRKYRICFIDYLWYVAEKWSEREHNNLNGGMLLFQCWLFAILIPVVIPMAFRYLGWVIALTAVISLCFLPFLFPAMPGILLSLFHLHSFFKSSIVMQSIWQSEAFLPSVP